MEINLWAVLVSAIASMVIGSIWFGPLFGKKFIHEMGMDQWSPERQAKEKANMWKSYVLQFVASLVMFYVLARFISQAGDLTVGNGICTALLVWIGFLVPTKIGDTIWGGKWTIFWMVIGNALVTSVAVGAILGAWR
jgi:hypothetical protein